MNKLIAALIWPFTATVAYVDARPTASMVKEHLTRHEIVTVTQAGGVVPALQLTGTDRVKASKDGARLLLSTDDLETAGYLTGLQHGYGLATEAALDLTRHEFKADSAALKPLRDAEKKAAKAERQAEKAEHATDVALAKAQRAEAKAMQSELTDGGIVHA